MRHDTPQMPRHNRIRKRGIPCHTPPQTSYLTVSYCSSTAGDFRSDFTQFKRIPYSHFTNITPIEIMGSQPSEDSIHVQGSQQQNVVVLPFAVEIHYEPRGEWTLHRLLSATEFLCGYCNKEKKAKLVATRQGAWNSFVCSFRI